MSTLDLANELAVNAKLFNALADQAHQLAGMAAIEESLTAVQLAALSAVSWHPGCFADHRLEEAVALAVPAMLRVPEVAGSLGDGVVYVLTQAYDTGGHTAYVQRCARFDSGRKHHVILTAPAASVPAALAESIAASGGQIVFASGATMVERAASVRQLCRDASLVLLLPHMQDPVTALAMAGGFSQPVAFVDHADHCFWLGASSVSSFVARQSGAELANLRRGIDPAGAYMLPIPLDRWDLPVSRFDARRDLGLSDSDVLVVTSGAAYKFGSAGGFLDVVTPLVAENENVVVLAEGPDAAHPEWAEASRMTGGRIRSLGTTKGVQRDALYAAADVFASSFPFSSNTAVLEAGALGLPVLAFVPGELQGTVLAPNNPGLGTVLCVASENEYGVAFRNLTEDAAYRRDVGRQLRETIRETCDRGPWLEAWNGLHQHAARPMTSAAAWRAPEAAPGTVDMTLAAMNAANPGVERKALVKALGDIRDTVLRVQTTMRSNQ